VAASLSLNIHDCEVCSGLHGLPSVPMQRSAVIEAAGTMSAALFPKMLRVNWGGCRSVPGDAVEKTGVAATLFLASGTCWSPEAVAGGSRLHPTLPRHELLAGWPGTAARLQNHLYSVYVCV
jgi:hypothetical protein